MTATPLYAADKYTYRVLWSEEDHQYVGVCTEFPSLSHLADAHNAALAGVVALVKDVLADMHTKKKESPVPMAIRRFKKDAR
jgi:hypothetical protein